MEPVGNGGEIHPHADRNEEKPEQQSLERLDIGFDLMAKLGFGEEQTGQERTQGHRQTGEIGEGGNPQRDEQRCRNKQFGAAGSGDHTEQRP